MVLFQQFYCVKSFRQYALKVSGPIFSFYHGTHIVRILSRPRSSLHQNFSRHPATLRTSSMSFQQSSKNRCPVSLRKTLRSIWTPSSPRKCISSKILVFMSQSNYRTHWPSIISKFLDCRGMNKSLGEYGIIVMICIVHGSPMDTGLIGIVYAQSLCVCILHPHSLAPPYS